MTATKAADPEEKELPPWRGSSILYRNVVSAYSFDKGADLTYNPEYSMELTVMPRWWFGKMFWVGVNFNTTTELTNSDWTTKERETLIGDTVLRFGASKFATIPVADIDFSAGVDLVTPTSKMSRARTLMLGLRGSLTVSRTFDVLKGISLSYTFQGTKNFHDSTTAELDAAPYEDSAEAYFSKDTLRPGVGAYGVSSDTLQGTGVRNADWRMVNLISAGIGFTDWLSMSTSFGFIHDFLYDQEFEDPYANMDPVLGSPNTRYTLLYELEVAFQPIKALGIAVGATTAHQQLGSDSTHRTPFFNRYTALYADIRFDVAGFISMLTPGEDN